MNSHIANAQSVRIVPLGRKRQRRCSRCLLTLAILIGALSMSACGSEGNVEVSSMTYDSYFASFGYDYNPAADISELSHRSAVVAIVTLVDIEDGRIFGDSANSRGGKHLNLVFETADATRYYVQLPRPSSFSIEQLRSVLPIGRQSVVYLQPNTDPDDGVWFNKRDDGNEWFFTTPQGWILDHPDRGIVFPLTHDEPFQVVPVVTETLSDWYVPKASG